MAPTWDAPQTDDARDPPAELLSSLPIADVLTSVFGKFFMNIHGYRLFLPVNPR